MKIVFLDRLTLANNIELSRPQFSHQWHEYPRSTSQQVLERANDADIIIVNKVQLNRQLLEQLPQLKMIAVAATGTNNVDLHAAKELNIVVSNVRDYASQSIAEHSLALMFNLRRNLLAYHQAIQHGRWQQSQQFCFFDYPIDNLAGQTLLVIGAGNLGQATAELASNIGMKVIFAEHKNKQPRPGRVDFNQALSCADVISIHCPLTPQTQDLIDEPEFLLMKKNALLINTARGGIVNEQALLQALQNKQIAGAASDVSESEPPKADSPLLQAMHLNSFIMSPHIGWASQQNMQMLADQVIGNIDAFAAGHPRHQVFPD
ncbi:MULTISPECIES: D-2-hydroxyacid dehydrogenase [unclassified Agarivorans]|uniref:D-2-hydroxyacid dehydrogenase n=1 Tax=unclassified Agarivorans TaxID=2636026 RepID=UPI0026E14D5B|nr:MULTISPECIES: D-2-hydroxyacid dehydrogenase [unclassified Agarivorans]MDO6688056.1 D-2-hydroxyacid dehydrogenase [Agarivorans sp. 3_MG-2023]MDO6717625.1 D-2-hydroxyacid dehydrogenase [Agarivorans sp. 2_MG-2023]